MKTQLSSVELAALVTEWQQLYHAKVDQIFHPSKHEILIRFHVPNLGKKMLRILTGKIAYLTEHKQDMPQPGGFCMRLRKHLVGGIVESIAQIPGQRIFELRIKNKEMIRIVFELFSKGNVIVANAENMILFSLETQQWESREVKAGVPYKIPPLNESWQTVTQENMESLIKTAIKDKIVTCLALELGLGGVYAEELCALAGVEKNTPPQKVTKSGGQKLWLALHELKGMVLSPQGYIYAKEIVPFKLVSRQENHEEYPTYNEALDMVLGSKILEHDQEQEQLDTELRQLNSILQQQQATAKALEREHRDLMMKGELIYEHYTHLKNILEETRGAAERDGWEALVDKIKGTVIKKLDAKHKRITVELPDR